MSPTEKSKKYPIADEELDEDDEPIWQPRARDRRLDDAYMGIERDEC